MDKKIIDGVDVSECDVYIEVHCKDKTALMFCDTNLCSNFPYCYFKQLKRLEQENEQLKADIQSRTMCITCERELQNCNLQAENEQLKQTLQEIKEIAEKDFRHTAWEEYARQLKEIITKINEVIGAE